jgi:fumarate reductase subunit C
MTSDIDDRPRPYRRRVSLFWWTERRSYLVFILRELSSVFVAWSAVFLLLLVRAVSQGADDYAGFLDWAATPWVVALNVIALAFVLLHAVTWFDLTARATVVRRGGRRVPSWMIAAGGYVAWVLVSVVVAWILLGA